MIWTIAYLDACDADIRRMSIDDARRIGEAVERFARDGSGDVKYDAARRILRIRAKVGVAVVRVDEGAMKLNVMRLLADDPLPYIKPLLDTPAPVPPDDR